MHYLRKFFAFIIILCVLTSCGLHKRIYLNSDNKIAIAPRGYSVKTYKGLETRKKQSLEKRNRIRNITLIVSANALIFIPIILSHHSDTPSEK